MACACHQSASLQQAHITCLGYRRTLRAHRPVSQQLLFKMWQQHSHSHSEHSIYYITQRVWEEEEEEEESAAAKEERLADAAR